MKHLRTFGFGRVGMLFLSTFLAVSGSCQAIVARPFGQTSKSGLSFDYVAIGDSITTGSSIPTCQDNRQISPWGCSESHLAAVPYPNRVALAVNDRFSNDPMDYTKSKLRQNKIDLYRAGIWGYTLREAVQAQASGKSQQGNWTAQLTAIGQARQFVTGSLGINDLHFSDVGKWARIYLQQGPMFISHEARRMIANQSPDFDKLFAAFRAARQKRVIVVTTLYYNPYDTDNPECAELKDIGNRIVGALDNELQIRARQNSLRIADFRRSFSGHGAGSEQSYVFGTECSVSGLVNAVGPAWAKRKDIKQAIGKKFDPHPNNNGTIAMSNAIMEQINGAD